MTRTSTQSGQGRWRQILSPQRPWLYLVYLCVYAYPWLERTPDGRELAISAVAVAGFLALFLTAMLRRDWTALPAAALTVGLGFALMPMNYGAAVFLIYAAAMLARMRDKPLRYAGLGAWAVAVISGCLWLGVSPLFLGGYLLFGGIVASATAWSAWREDRDLLQEELEADAASRAAEAERQRIARDLHDLLGHTLSLVTLKADLAGRVFDADPERARAELAAIETISREALAEVREVVTGLRARPLGEVAREMAERLRGAGLAVTLDIGALPADLPEPAQAALGMVLREGATNILRHSGARHVRIETIGEGGSEGLRIADDGRGGVQFAGRGLDGLRDRLAAAGLTLDIGPREDGKGSRLDARWSQGDAG